MALTATHLGQVSCYHHQFQSDPTLPASAQAPYLLLVTQVMGILGFNGPESTEGVLTCLLTTQGNLLPVSVVLIPAARCVRAGV